MSIRTTVISEIESVTAQNGKHLARLSDDIALMETGLDSLCLAVVVARLEDRLGIDPFSSSENTDFPMTLGDLVRMYEAAAS
jgi:acyl carrier protein